MWKGKNDTHQKVNNRLGFIKLPYNVELLQYVNSFADVLSRLNSRGLERLEIGPEISTIM